ncbi:kinase-like domain-containing protein [Scleroderma citrinum]
MSDLECKREEVFASEMYDERMERMAVVASWKENGKYYWARLPVEGSDLLKPNLDDAERHEIPCIEEFWGKWDEGMLEAPLHLHGASEVYIKKPQISRYAGDAVAAELAKEDPTKTAPDLCRSKSNIAAAFRRDATMYETLRRSPHKNIAVYYGCVREGNHHFSGICMKRYRITLFEVMHAHMNEQKLNPERISEIIEGVHAGLRHIHSLGYVHNDVTPTNIMIDEDGHPVLIDFDACRKLGDVTKGDRAGTPGYGLVPRPERYEAENDFHMLAIIEEEMRAGKGPFSRV